MFVGNRGGFNKNKNRTFTSRIDASGKSGLTVEVRNNDVNKALRKLKKKLQNEGTLQEVRDRQYYVKPSEKRRLAKKAGKKRWLKKQREMNAEWGQGAEDRFARKK